MKSILIGILFSYIIIVSNAFAQNIHRRTFINNNFSTVNNHAKVAFFDADSTLRVSLSGSVSANSSTDVMILPNVEAKIAKLSKAGYLVAIVSNQGGVQAGIVSLETADTALLFTTQLIQQKNPEAKIHYYDFSEGNDEFRKPLKGMAIRLESLLQTRGLAIDWQNSFMVGDSAYKKNKDIRPDGKPGTHFSNSDRLFAENLGISFIEATDFFGWRAAGIDVFETAKEVESYLKRQQTLGLNCSMLLAQ